MKKMGFLWTVLGLLLIIRISLAQSNTATNAPAANATPALTNTPAAANLPPPSPPLKVEAPNEVDSALAAPPAATNHVAITPPAIPAAAGATNAPTGPATTNTLAEAEEKIDEIKFPNVELFTAIKGLAQKANINVLFDPALTNINATVNFTLKNLTFRQALVALLKNNGLILEDDPETQTSRVKRKDPQAPEPVYSRIFQLQYSNPTNMMTLIKAAKGTFGGDKSRIEAIPDVRTSKILVIGTTNELTAIEALILNMDTQTRQVLIEARLLETSHSPQSVRGIDWSGTLSAQRVSFGNGLTAGSSSTTTPGQSTTINLPSGRSITTDQGSSSQSSYTTTFGNSGTPSVTASGLSLNTAKGFTPMTAIMNADGVSAVLSFLNQNSDTEVIATPRAVTLDNEMATLEVTRGYPIFLITPGSASVAGGAQINYTNVGTILKVTPRISGTNTIQLTVEPEVSNIDSKDQQTINGQINSANVYAYRKIKTHVSIPNGRTLVMGGLISDNTTKTSRKVPILGDLPVVGLAFRQDSKSRVKQNLLIFITPTILQDQDFQEIPASGFLKMPPRDAPISTLTPMDSGKPLDLKHPSGWNKPEN